MKYLSFFSPNMTTEEKWVALHSHYLLEEITINMFIYI
jgi:hypothetical protein